MRKTEFDDLLPQHGSAATKQTQVPNLSTGQSITPSEISSRLSANLYAQLADGSDNNVVSASERAIIHVGAIYGRLGRQLSLDDAVSREIVLLYTVYEMHLALGHEEAGREYRIKAKDLIIATYGTYPESEKQASNSPLAAITVPQRKPFPRAF